MSFRDRLSFDAARGEYLDSGIRYMMIRPDALMGILHELPEESRPAVLEAMARSITKAGGKSAAAYRDMGAAEADALLGVIAATAPELGWGVWSFARGADGLTLTVANAPFPAGHGPAPAPVCAPIRGMLGAIGPMVLGGPVRVEETGCAACGAAHCTFTIAPA
ncbi:V4R domain-containing protein [Oceanicella sp. SM1341]|uniref:V4R domain-containing protein n=1 Tax=Oceanicella sp. SM1341 TaxID=1548889 RepID=UPI000E4E85FC|nr:V4R domain-containing protein [Oceanicella sp. SM1341]